MNYDIYYNHLNYERSIISEYRYLAKKILKHGNNSKISEDNHVSHHNQVFKGGNKLIEVRFIYGQQTRVGEWYIGDVSGEGFTKQEFTGRDRKFVKRLDEHHHARLKYGRQLVVIVIS